MYPTLSYNPSVYRIDRLDGGIVIDRSENKIGDNQSPDMLNMYYDGNTLKKREGQLMLFLQEDIYACAKEAFYNHFVYHTGDKIKAYNIDTKEITTLFGPVKKKKGCFFLYNGYLYYIGTGNYYKIIFENNALSCSEVEGYIPTVLINCESNSLGDEGEAYNYLTGYFKYSYNTGSDTKSIKLPSGVNTQAIKITYNSKEITDFTVNTDSGYIIFSSALGEGHNLLEITYLGIGNEDRKKITNCTIAESYGGLSAGISEGTRVFLSGNEDYKTTFFYSELKNPEYFPVNQFDILGDDNDPVMCMGKQYDGLVFFKKNSIYIAYYQYIDSTVNFTLSRLNSDIGCDCKYTLTTVDNQLVWLNSIRGVMTLFSTNIKEEKNVKCISSNINGVTSKKALLLQEDIENAVSFVNRGKLYIVTSKYTYVLNISNDFYIGKSDLYMSWFLMDNIEARDFIYFNKEVYLASSKGFSYFNNVLYDFEPDTPIKAYINTKAIDFDAPEYFKSIFDLSFSLRALNNSFFRLEIFDENGNVKKDSEYFINKFNFLNFSFSNFTFLGNMFSFVFKRRVTRSRTKYLMLKFSNDKKNSQMNISDISINYQIERSARFNGI